MKKIKKTSTFTKVLFIIIVLLTLIRIYLQSKMPLFLQAGAGYDDYLLVNYTKELLCGNWLGDFGTLTLAKSISFSVFLLINYVLGTSYSVVLIVLYIFSILLFINVIRKYIPNKYYLMVVYLALLYCPIMFHIENVQKVYRGGLIIIFSILVISSIIGIYNKKDEKISRLLVYSLLGCLFLPFFYFLKEDSIWIMPFVLGGLSLTIIYLFKNNIDKKVLRSVIVLLPVISLILIKNIYCGINYLYYGEYTITDRSGTYYKEVLSDLIKIRDDNKNSNIWISKVMFYKAIDNSKTLKTIEPSINKMYNNSWALKNGEIEGDIIYWTIREAVEDAGIYKKGGKEVNKFYQNIDKELKLAFSKGDLKQEKNKLYISSIGNGYSMDEIIKYYKNKLPEVALMLITYNQNETSVNKAFGQDEGIILMDALTNSVTVWPQNLPNLEKSYSIIVSICNKIVDLYKSLGLITFIMGLLGFIVLIKNAVIDIIKKEDYYLSLLLILLGIICNCIVLLFGVMWFTGWMGNTILRHVYNYTGSIIPLLEILKITGIYFLILEISNRLRRNQNEKKCR